MYHIINVSGTQPGSFTSAHRPPAARQEHNSEPRREGARPRPGHLRQRREQPHEMAAGRPPFLQGLDARPLPLTPRALLVPLLAPGDSRRLASQPCRARLRGEPCPARLPSCSRPPQPPPAPPEPARPRGAARRLPLAAPREQGTPPGRRGAPASPPSSLRFLIYFLFFPLPMQISTFWINSSVIFPVIYSPSLPSLYASWH